MNLIDFNTLGAGVFMTAVAHPISYCKVLIQLGHEPLAPVIRRNAFFRKQLQYPNIFQYMKHIRAMDGTFGLYRGLAPRICANLSTSITFMAVANRVQIGERTDPPKSSDDIKTILRKITEETSREMTAKCCAIIVSQPFHVIAIRCMAQFVGHETLYSTMLSSTKEIYNEEGILGFFAGIIPRLAAEIAQIWLCNVLAHLLNVYLLNEKSDFGELRQYSQAATGYIASVITYPISLTSTVMAVNGSRLSAARAPCMVTYSGWWSCLKDLRKKGQSNRGSSLLFRRTIHYVVRSTDVTPMPPPPPIAK